MCGDVWENVTKRLSHKIAGESRGEQLEGRHWHRFARECGLNPRQVVDRVSTLAKSALAKAEEAAAEVAGMPAGAPRFRQLRGNGRRGSLLICAGCACKAAQGTRSLRRLFAIG